MNEMRKLMEATSALTEEDWQVDYDPDEGMTAICPRCGSNEIYSELVPNVTTSVGRLACDNCGHKEQTKFANPRKEKEMIDVNEQEDGTSQLPAMPGHIFSLPGLTPAQRTLAYHLYHDHKMAPHEVLARMRIGTAMMKAASIDGTSESIEEGFRPSIDELSNEALIDELASRVEEMTDETEREYFIDELVRRVEEMSTL